MYAQLWVSDPCHGNTESTADGIKFRNIEKVMGEMIKVFRIHAQYESRLGGVHLELTGTSSFAHSLARMCLILTLIFKGDDVTECVGGSAGLEPTNLSTNYQSFCDPRLNYTQSLDMAFCIAAELKAIKKVCTRS